MKKIILLLSIFNTKSFAQAKMEVVVSATENLNGLNLNHENPNCLSCTALKNNSEAQTGLSITSTRVNSYGLIASSVGVYSEAIYGNSSLGTGVSGVSTYGTAVKGFCNNGTGSETGYAASFVHADNNGSALVTGTGRVGIGTFSPFAKMDIKGSLYSSHFYYSQNEDTYIRGGKGGSKVLINDIAGMGSVGIAHANPNELLDVNGRMKIRHNLNTSGLWMSNSTNSLSDADGPFYGMINDTQTGIFIGNSWRFAFNSNGNAVITVFTQLGYTVPAGAAGSASAPTIKTMVLTGTTASTEGASASVATGLLNSKILSYNVLVQNGTSQIQPEHTDEAGRNYHTFLNNGNIFIRNSATESAFILSKSFKVLEIYTE